MAKIKKEVYTVDKGSFEEMFGKKKTQVTYDMGDKKIVAKKGRR
ncbi:MAG: hypothetical protein ACFFAU_01225 [Candidatus Hodarchaeota archaeon]